MPENNTTDIQNILKNIAKSKRIAIALPAQVSVDALCAALALQAALQTDSEKKDIPAVMIFSAGQDIPALPFLRRAPQIHSATSGGSQLAIKVSNKNAEPGELRYEKSSDGLTVFITPKGESPGTFTEQDVTVLPAVTNFDLVVIIGASNFEQLGKIYTDNTKLFFGTPNINLDINPSNEYYGTMNFVNTTASSLCEVMMDIIEALPDGLPKNPENTRAATTLLAGIISQTASFRDPKTTPQALLKASRLVTAGARQQDIIQHLFKTKPLPLLQLWGRALARLTEYPEKKIITAIVTASDLEKTKVPIDSLPIVLRDIVEMVTGYSLVILVAETGVQSSQLLIAGLPFEKISKLAQGLSGTDQSGVVSKLLTGKYEYVSVAVPLGIDQTQIKLAELIEKHQSVV
jgi:nanoRNase/pAp phosphatase (c-di-AMP/oligoRNAs hydrolase)